MFIVVSLFGFVVGVCLGSFAKAIADRSIDKQSYTGRSYCQSCKKTLRWYDLFPVVSYLLLQGKCRYCKRPIPAANLVAELILGILSALIFAQTIGANLTQLSLFKTSSIEIILSLLFQLFVVTVMTIVFFVDFKTYIIPDRIVFPATLVSGLYLLLFSGFKSWEFYQNIQKVSFAKYLLPPYSNYFVDEMQRLWMGTFTYVLSGIIAAGIFIALIVITKGRGMGWGDVKYVFFLGLVLGFPNIALALFLSFFTGAVFSVLLIILKRKSFGQVIPFGPFLTIGATVALLWGSRIIDLYLTLSFGNR